MVYQQLVSFGMGLYTGLNLFATNTDVALSMTFLLGILVGAAASELNTYDRRRQNAVSNPGNLQGQHPAIESATTSTADEGSSSIMPEIAWFLSDDVVGEVADIPDHAGATCPSQISSHDNVAADIYSPLQTNTPQAPFVVQGGSNATRESSPDPHFQAVVVNDGDMELVNHPNDTAGMAETYPSESLATLQLATSPHQRRSGTAPRRSLSLWTRPWRFLKARKGRKVI
ncbi:MAG: hypothetical protein Q9225_004772 [Loekoesia sp. 1 TL-2023]